MTTARSATPGASEPSPVGHRFGRELRFLLAGLPLGVAAFVTAIAGFTIGAALFVVLLGIPVLLGTLRAARGFARVERRAVESATGRPLPPHHYRDTGGPGLKGALRAVLEPQSWRDLSHMVLAFPVRIASACLALVWTLGGLAELLYGTWSWAIPRGGGAAGLADLLFGNPTLWLDISFHTAIGVVLLATCVPVVRGLVAIHAGLARGLLTNQTAALRARNADLAAGRRSAVAAEARTLRRLERDLHDGPQQRLVRLNMDLEAVGRRLDDDPERARPLVEQAISQSHEALAELRALSRGIAPPVLADRGLVAAVATAAARCPVPISLATEQADGLRFNPVVENTAYFVVAEALTNVAKHARADRCTVTVTVDEERMHVTISDNGRGGAHLGKGHGLAGLSERLAAVEGVLDVSSPPGGPTEVTAVIPLSGVGDHHAGSAG